MTEREIFIEALKRETGSERQAYLDGACGKNVQLRERIERLLAKHECEADFFLDKSSDFEKVIDIIAEITAKRLSTHKGVGHA